MMDDLPVTSVRFNTNDAGLKRACLAAEDKLRENLRDFAGRRVLVEGAGYEKVWLETQPMGGEMYACRDLRAALNNQLLFMEHRREDGRLPGSVMLENGRLVPQFNKFQGFCFPGPALNIYFWMGRDKDYLAMLKSALEGFDRYLWANRDSDGDGCLESWCVTDTGEDGALRLGDAPFWREEETPPEGFDTVPMASMDVMSFSYNARHTLALISVISGDGKEGEWRKKAEDVRRKIREYLWDDGRGACFDRKKGGQVMPALVHNNLRCMYWESLYPDMAARFVKEHLLNPAEFWTPFPLPSVGANDPLFRNNPGNDWSGQPQGLTWQRAIDALSNYGFDPLVPVLGEKLISALIRDGVFTQQFDPFTGKPTGGKDGYGPTMLALLEYVTRMHGVRVQGDTLRWGAWGQRETEYELRWGDRLFTIRNDKHEAQAYVNGRHAFTVGDRVSVITDYDGNVLRLI